MVPHRINLGFGISRMVSPTEMQYAVELKVASVSNMSSGFNVFGPEELDRAESILSEVWNSVPGDVRKGPGADILRERMARHVLAALANSGADRDELKASVMRAGASDWARA